MQRRGPSVLIAAIAAGLVVGTQVASKAARDALFLSTFPARDLPKIMLGAAVVSLAVAFASSRAMARMGPSRIVPAALLANGALFVCELLALGASPRAATVALYLHVAALGGALVSGLWSVVGERFDPHRARLAMGRIGTGATLGGAIGGLAADLASRVVGPRGLLVVLTLASVMAALFVDRVGRGAPARSTARAPEATTMRAIAGTPHIRTLAALGLIAATWAALFDYAFKITVARDVPADPGAWHAGSLVTFFGWYYTLSSGLAFLVQSTLGSRVLTRYGLTVTVTILPLSVALGGLAGAALPLLYVVSTLRGSESVLSNSLYRAGYELYFTPLASETKRAAKTLVDVAATRLGDGLGSGLVFAALALWPDIPVSVPLVATSAAAVIALGLVPRLHRGYVSALEGALRAGVVHLGDQVHLDATTKKTLTDTTQSLDRERLLEEIEAYRRAQLAAAPPLKDIKNITIRSAGAPAIPVEAASLRGAGQNARAAAAHALCSGDEAAARSALEAGIEPALSRLAVPLLAHATLGALATKSLEKIAKDAAGSLEDALLDRREPRGVRVRVAALLPAAGTARARLALLAGLEDPALEVRIACGRSLARLAAGAADLRPTKQEACALVARALELAADERPRSMPPLAPGVTLPIPLPDALAVRLDPVVLHALTLLSTAIDPEALALAGRALAGSDAALRGTALEYLENVVDGPARDALLARIGESGRAPTARRSERELVEELLKTRS